jgi:hypothetical protein
MKEIRIEFSRKTTYHAVINIDDSLAEKIIELENDDVNMYLKKTGGNRFSPNPIYELLNDAATDNNVFEDDDRFEDVCAKLNQR